MNLTVSLFGNFYDNEPALRRLTDDEGLLNQQLAELTHAERIIYNALNDEFTTNDLKNVAIERNINADTARRYLGKFANTYHIVERVKNGLYRKTKKQA